MPTDCLICVRVAAWHRNANPYVIAAFEHSIFVVGDHQFHRGCCLVLLKDHVRELHELPPEVQAALWQEVMRAGQALVRTFHPWKMNYACYGNAEPHVHWHLFPRCETDPDRTNHPWLHADRFKEHTITHEQARAMAAGIRENL